MKANNKAILIITALFAITAGFLLNKQKLTVADDIDTSALLNAALVTVNQSDGELGQTSIRPLLGKLTLVNFWATWCTPCREEMPIFDAVYRENLSNNFQIIGITIDSVDKAQPFLDSMDIKYPIVYAEKTGFELMELTSNPNGLLPYSLLLNQSGEMLEAKLGKLDEKKLNSWLKKYLK